MTAATNTMLISERGMRYVPSNAIPDEEHNDVRSQITRELSHNGAQDLPIIQSSVVEGAESMGVDPSELLGLLSGERSKRATQSLTDSGDLSFTHILVNKIVETMNSQDADDQYDGMIYIAAIATMAANSIARSEDEVHSCEDCDARQRVARDIAETDARETSEEDQMAKLIADLLQRVGWR